jgi:hypothetical protein
MLTFVSMQRSTLEHMFETMTQEGRLARIAELERLNSAHAAEQAVLAAEFDAQRRSEEAARGVPATQRGRGVAAEIALARRESPNTGGRHLGFARALVHEMPHTLAALATGALSEWRATLIVRESACLSVEHRRQLDEELCGDPTRLDGCGNARIEAEAKAIAYRLDPRAIVERAARAEHDRTVTIRPAPDCMTYVTATLPVAQGVSVYAALKRSADTTCDGRGRGQVMADTLVERVTGLSDADAVSVAVNVVLSDETLMGGDDPATLSDYGPIPAEIACRLVEKAVTHPQAKATLRKLYARPSTGALVALQSQARAFPKALAAFIKLRDQRCRTPYCDAPVRHSDHITPWSKKGTTSADNGQGLCEHCNYLKEFAAWKVRVQAHESGRHQTIIETPTGTCHHSQAPPILPGRRTRDHTPVEHHARVLLYDLHAA